MTREEILAMKADGLKLELSNAVATRIMGWHRHSTSGNWIDDDGNARAHWRWSPERYIQNAWQVVEMMRNNSLASWLNFGDALEEVIKTEGAPVTTQTLISFSLNPEAICKAALLAKGVE